MRNYCAHDGDADAGKLLERIERRYHDPLRCAYQLVVLYSMLGAHTRSTTSWYLTDFKQRLEFLAFGLLDIVCMTIERRRGYDIVMNAINARMPNEGFVNWYEDRVIAGQRKARLVNCMQAGSYVNSPHLSIPPLSLPEQKHANVIVAKTKLIGCLPRLDPFAQGVIRRYVNLQEIYDALDEYACMLHILAGCDIYAYNQDEGKLRSDIDKHATNLRNLLRFIGILMRGVMFEDGDLEWSPTLMRVRDGHDLNSIIIDDLDCMASFTIRAT